MFFLLNTEQREKIDYTVHVWSMQYDKIEIINFLGGATIFNSNYAIYVSDCLRFGSIYFSKHKHPVLRCLM